MSRDFFLRIALPVVLYCWFGWWVGTKLIAIRDFQTFKVLNIVGLSYDFIGITVLSRLVSSNTKYQSLISGTIATQFSGLVVFSGLGLILCSAFGPDGPSKARLESFAINAFILFAAPTITYVNSFVIGVDNELPWSEETRTKLFGGFFLLSGILIQLYAAILDLYT